MNESKLISYANKTPKVLSLLYDLDLMPEQVQDGRGRGRMLGVIAHCVAIRGNALLDAAKIVNDARGTSETDLRTIAANIKYQADKLKELL